MLSIFFKVQFNVFFGFLKSMLKCSNKECFYPASVINNECSQFLRYLNAIQTMCPHILRYLTTAVITNKDVRKRRQVLKDLVKVIQQVLDRICLVCMHAYAL